MLDPITRISDFVINSFFHIWPYLLVTIPLAVAVQMSGASRFIKRAFQARPVTAILLATAVGAFSPFCSCGVIPVIASLLISGVPLAPVMSFWIASPSMDPEIFFLSVGLIGWELAIWRMAATLILSLTAGFVTQAFMAKGLSGLQILRSRKINTVTGEKRESCCRSRSENLGCGDSAEPFVRRLAKETLGATLMVAKFMVLAFFLEALITLYIPGEWITAALGSHNPLVILTAAFLGVPAYTTSLTALPMISGLLTQGMSPAAALAFLVAGPTTTLPAMAAVWPLVARRVFVLYISFALLGAILIGYIYKIVGVIYT